MFFLLSDGKLCSKYLKTAFESGASIDPVMFNDAL